MLLYLFLVSTAALIVSISHGVMVVRGRRYHRSLGGGTMWASLVVVTAVHRSIRNRQEVVLLDIFLVRLEGDKVVGLGSQLLMDRVQ